MSQCGTQCILAISVVGFFWGATNPLLRSASKSRISHEGGSDDRIVVMLVHFLQSFTDWKFFVPFVLNQCGSILFNVLLVYFPVTAVVPCVNAVQLISTFTVGWLMGEQMESSSSLKQATGLFLSLTAIIGLLFID